MNCGTRRILLTHRWLIGNNSGIDVWHNLPRESSLALPSPQIDNPGMTKADKFTFAACLAVASIGSRPQIVPRQETSASRWDSVSRTN
jgi:hypothetical protein